MRESILIDRAQHRPARAAIEKRLNLFVTEFSWHEERLTRAKSALGVAVRQRPPWKTADYGLFKPIATVTKAAFGGLSDDNRWINAQSIEVAGGFVI